MAGVLEGGRARHGFVPAIDRAAAFDEIGIPSSLRTASVTAVTEIQAIAITAKCTRPIFPATKAQSSTSLHPFFGKTMLFQRLSYQPQKLLENKMPSLENIRSSRALGLIAWIACAAWGPASAQTVASSDLPVVHVKTQDLRLELPADQKILDRRIASAARTVCQEWQGLSDFAQYGRCLYTARKTAGVRRDALVERALQHSQQLAQLCFLSTRCDLATSEAPKLTSADTSK